MKLTQVKPYFRTILDAKDLREWKDGFNFENIPRSIFHKAYHLEFAGLDSTSTSVEQDSLVSLITRVFLKGYRKPDEGIDEALDLGESIIIDALNVSTRFGTDLHNVQLASMNVLPVLTNDNFIILEIDFSVRVFFDLC